MSNIVARRKGDFTPADSKEVYPHSTPENRGLDEEHYRELVEGSAIDPELAAANCYTGATREWIEYQFEEIPHPDKHTNSGAPNRNISKRIAALEATGDTVLVFQGVNPSTHEPSTYKRCKTLQPSIRWKKSGDGWKQKPAKYQGPDRVALQLFFARVPVKIWQKISDRYSVPVAGANFWEWVRKNDIPIVLTEGEKKALCLLSCGYTAIGLPGVNTGYRRLDDGTAQLRDELQPFNTKREIVILFDHETKPEPLKFVTIAAKRTAQLFTKAHARIAHLPGPEKGIDDFICAGGDIAPIIAEAKSLSHSDYQSRWKLSYKRNLVINQRYISSSLSSRISKNGAKFLKSAKGTGKTHFLESIVTPARNAGRPVILLGHRRVLVKEIAGKLNLHYIGDGDDGSGIFGKALCVDSLHPKSKAKFAPEDWAGGVVILDEVEQVIWHLLESSTCKEERIEILKNFRSLISTVLSTGGMVISQDADLSDYSIDFILKQCDKPVQPWILENTYKPETGWDITLFKDKESLVSQLLSEILAGGKPWVQVDAQKVQSKTGTINIELYLEEKLKTDNPGLKILRIDADTTKDPQHPAYGCAGNINQIVADYDIVICSPSLATGVSIDIKGHFTAVFGIFSGSTPENEARQALARVRESVPRYLFAAERAPKPIAGGGTSANQIIKNKLELCETNIELLKQFQQLQAADEAAFNFDLPGSYCPLALQTWALMVARNNLGGLHFRSNLIAGLKAEGHHLHADKEQRGGEIAIIKDELKKIRGRSEAAKYEAISKAQDLDESEYLELKNKISRTKDESLAEDKYILKSKYGIEVTPAVAKIDSQNAFACFQFHYLLTLGNKHLQARDKRHLERHLERGQGNLFIPDLKLFTTQIKLLQKMNIEQFLLDPSRVWTKHDAEVIAFGKFCHRYRRQIALALGIAINPKDCTERPFNVVQSILQKLGLKLDSTRRRVNGVREYLYSNLHSIFEDEWPELRPQIFKNWLEKDEFLATKSCSAEVPQTQTQQGLDPVPSKPLYSYITNQQDRTAEMEPETSTPVNEVQPVAGWRGLLCRLKDGVSFTGGYENLKAFANSIFQIESRSPHLAPDGRTWRVQGFCQLSGKYLGNLPAEWLEAA